MKSLTVINPFEGREIGDRIDSPAEIEEILGGEHAQHVNPTGSPEADAGQAAAREPNPSNQEKPE